MNDTSLYHPQILVVILVSKFSLVIKIRLTVICLFLCIIINLCCPCIKNTQTTFHFLRIFQFHYVFLLTIMQNIKLRFQLNIHSQVFIQPENFDFVNHRIRLHG